MINNSCDIHVSGSHCFSVLSDSIDCDSVEKAMQRLSVKSTPVLPDPEIVMAMESPEERGGLFAARNFIVGRLKETGWAHEQVMSPSQLGVHPCNRGNYGCNEEYVHQLAADIFEVGWDASKVAGALCVEDNNQRTIELHNINLTKASEFLAPVEPRSIAAGTLTNGHTVLLLRALVHGVKCNQPSISVDGIMSMAKVEHVRPLMAQAAKQGWVWTVLSKDCAAVYGNRLFEFLSGAHNVQLSRVEHELEVLLKMFRHASDCEKKSELIDWSQIMKMILRTKPECSDYISSMIKFLEEFGGGSGAPFVDELIRFHRKHVPGHRLVGGSFWEHLASLNFVSKAENINTPGILMRYAILKAEYRCPADKVVNRVCKFISKTDLDTLAKQSVKAVCAAEVLLSECRRIVLAHGGDVSGDTLSKQFGLLDIAVVRLLLNKQQSSPIKFASIEAVACYFIEQLNMSLLQGTQLIDNPWEAFHTSTSSSSQGDTSVSTSMRTLDLKGNVVPVDQLPILRSKGFDVGTVVMPKGAKAKDALTMASICQVSVDGVVLDGPNGKIEVQMHNFVAAWVPYVEEWFEQPNDHVGLAIAGAKSLVQFALCDLASSANPKVRMQSKPSKRVLADCDFIAGTLQLVPTSMSIVTVTSGSPPPLGLEVSVSTMAAGVCRFFVMPASFSTDDDKRPINAPIWAVNVTDDQYAANMEHSEIEVQVSINSWAQSKKKGKAKCAIVKFTCMHNMCAISKGDELLIFKPDTSKKQRRSRSCSFKFITIDEYDSSAMAIACTVTASICFSL